MFARTEGIVPAPEIDACDPRGDRRGAEGAAKRASRRRSSSTSRGHGHFDMQAYIDYFAGKLEDQDYDPKALEASLAHSAEGGGGVKPAPFLTLQGGVGDPASAGAIGRPSFDGLRSALYSAPHPVAKSHSERQTQRFAGFLKARGSK